MKKLLQLPTLLIGAAIVVIAAAVWCMSGSDSSGKAEDRQTLRSRKIVDRKARKENRLARLRKDRDGKKTAKKVNLGTGNSDIA